jgi:hypothetical protein
VECGRGPLPARRRNQPAFSRVRRPTFPRSPWVATVGHAQLAGGQRAPSNAGNWRSTGRTAVATDSDKTESWNRVSGFGCEVGKGRFGVAADR